MAKSTQLTVPENVDEVLERNIKAEAKRREYQTKPEVKAKRKAYQQKQTLLRKMARAALKGDVAALVEMGYNEADAKVLVSKAGSGNVTG